MEIYIRKTGELAGAMEIAKYPNSPLIKSDSGKSVLVAYDGTNEYILGYITKGDTSNPVIVYSQHFLGKYGHILNDVYNNVQDADDLSSTSSKKKRTLLLGESKFIGSIFYEGDDDPGSPKFGFGRFTDSWYTHKNYGSDEREAPVAPNKDDEHHFISLDNGNKFYQSASGSLQEAKAIRVNIGVPDVDIHSYGTWDRSTLSVETPIERSIRSMDEASGLSSGARSGAAFPNSFTYHLYNFQDSSSFFMGNGIIEISNNSINDSEFSTIVWDADGVLITTDTTGKVIIDVNGTKLTIEDGTVTVLGTMVYDGDVSITGNLEVTGTTDLTGKLSTIGGSDLA